MSILKKHSKIGFITILTALVIVSSVLYLKATNKLGTAIILIESEDTPNHYYCEDTLNGGRVFIDKADYKQGDKVLYIRKDIKSTAIPVMTIEKSNLDIVDAISY